MLFVICLDRMHYGQGNFHYAFRQIMEVDKRFHQVSSSVAFAVSGRSPVSLSPFPLKNAMKNQKKLFDAIGNQDDDKIRDLLESQPDLANPRGPHGKTPLEAAIESGYAGAVEALLDCGAEANAKGHHPDDRTPIIHALHCKPVNLEIIGYLVAHGADLEDSGGGGFSPLELAVMSQNVDLVKCLLDLGVDYQTYLDEERWDKEAEKLWGSRRTKLNDKAKVINRMLREMAKRPKQ